MEGKGKLTITGKLGEVMQESAQAAMSYIRSRALSLGLPRDFYRNLDVHMHIPEGAIPKDGPSAGITLATTICSALTKIPVRGDRGHDRRNHAARQGAAHRRPQGEADGGAPPRHPGSHHAAGEREGPARTFPTPSSRP